MEIPDDLTLGLGPDFSGEVRLFPLPNVVLFPNVLLPLHIFEPRYIAMTEDALADDKLIAMALPRSDFTDILPPGHLAPREPDLLPVLCIGRIAHHVQLDDGRYNLILQGVQRASIVEELPQTALYRQASVELLVEEAIDNASVEDQRRAQLLGIFRQLFPNLTADPDLSQVFESMIPLGTLCDVFAYALSLAPHQAQGLLAEFSVDRRSRLLLEIMRAAAEKQPLPLPPREYPPPFSLN